MGHSFKFSRGRQIAEFDASLVYRERGGGAGRQTERQRNQNQKTFDPNLGGHHQAKQTNKNTSHASKRKKW